MNFESPKLIIYLLISKLMQPFRTQKAEVSESVTRTFSDHRTLNADWCLVLVSGYGGGGMSGGGGGYGGESDEQPPILQLGNRFLVFLTN